MSPPRPARRAAALAGAVACTVGIAASCSRAADPTESRVADLRLSDSTLTLRVGDDVALSARVLDATGNDLSGRRIFWSSRDTTIVAVTQAGVLRATGTGATQVAANVEGRSAPATVTVLARPVASLQIDPATTQLVVTTRRRLSTRALNDQGVVVSTAVTWTSLNPDIASVTSSGEVAGVAPGVATVQAAADGQTATAAVVVTAVPVASIRLTPAADTSVVGGTRQLTATPLDSAGGALSARTVAWTSRDPNVASVSSSGLVTAVSPGTAVVVATIEGRTASASVVVRAAAVSSVAVTPPASSIGVGGSVRLSATPRDAAGNALAGRTVAFSSANAALATVGTDGTVTGVAAGTATIRATSEGITGTATVQVTTPATNTVASVEVAPGTASLTVGDTRTFVATPRTTAGAAITGRTVTWSSGAPSVLTVSSAGVVTAVGAGTGQVLAQVDGVTGTATVAVQRVPVAAVTVTPGSTSVPAGSATQLAAAVRDAGGTTLSDRAVAWSSSNESVASVSSTGRVVGTAPGTATISATSEGVTGTSTVSVSQVVRIAPDTVRVRDRSNNNRTAQLTAVDQEGRSIPTANVTWATSNAAIATVDASGLVRGVGEGTATISATVRGVTATATAIVTRN